MNAEAIRCPACGEDSFLKREPKYDGFTKTGERLRCAACRHVFDNEADVPFRKRHTPAVFNAAERPATPAIFDDAEIGRSCRHCEHYVINPFTQRCALHNRDVEATDRCDRFTPQSAPESSD